MRGHTLPKQWRCGWQAPHPFSVVSGSQGVGKGAPQVGPLLCSTTSRQGHIRQGVLDAQIKQKCQSPVRVSVKHQIIKILTAYSTHSVKLGQNSKARNQPHSGFASMDDGLSDKHPGEPTFGFSQVLLLEIQIKKSCHMAAIICSTKRWWSLLRCCDVRCFFAHVRWLPEGANPVIFFWKIYCFTACHEAIGLKETREPSSLVGCFHLNPCGMLWWDLVDIPYELQESHWESMRKSW